MNCSDDASETLVGESAVQDRVSRSKFTISTMARWPFLLNVEVQCPGAAIESETLCPRVMAALLQQRAKLMFVGPARPYLKTGIALQIAVRDGEKHIQIDPHPAHGDLAKSFLVALSQPIKVRV